MISEKVHVGKMDFPHLPRPPAPSLELRLHLFSCRKLPDFKTVENKSAANRLCDRCSAAPNKSTEHRIGCPFCIQKINKVPFYDHENGCPMLNRSPKINFQIHQKRHSSHVEVITVFTKFPQIGGGARNTPFARIR